MILEEHTVLDSTMKEIKRRIEQNEEVVNRIITANNQTNGYGRRGRTWFANEGNIMMSLCIEEISTSDLNFIPLIIALAIKTSISEERCQIKWPNDILINNKKVCGILIEKIRDIIIIGIGVNLVSSPSNMSYASNLKDQDINIKKHDLIYQIIGNIRIYIHKLNRDRNNIINEYLKNVAYLDRRIIVKVYDNSVKEGIFKGIDYEGQLLLAINKDNIIKVSCGEIYKLDDLLYNN